MTEKQRLDKLMVERGLVDSRQRAQAMILAGQVLVEEQMIDKAGAQVPIDAGLRIKGEALPYVSRGGLKLEGALDAFSIDVTGCVAIDVGASTGGFTDCLLQRGASRVYAVDVGYGQLAWKLRQSSRVINLERTNIRDLAPSDLPEKPELAVIDASFISLEKVLPPTLALLRSNARIVALIKPQFEVGRGQVGKGGVVRDAQKHQAVIEKITLVSESLHCSVLGVRESSVFGPKGNREFLIYLRKNEPDNPAANIADEKTG